MRVTSRTQGLRVYTTTVIAHEHAPAPGGVYQFVGDAFGAGVAECAGQGLAPNAVGLIASNRVSWPIPPVNHKPKINLVLIGEFLSDAGKCLFKIERIGAGKAHTSNCVPSLFNDFPHQLLYMVQPGLGWRIIRHLIRRDIELHGCAKKSL